MMLEADGALNICNAETGQVIVRLEGVEVWRMLQATPGYPYFPQSGRCIVCGADTLWGDAPHKGDCQIVRYCNNCGKVFIAAKVEDSTDFHDICSNCCKIYRFMDDYENDMLDEADKYMSKKG